MLIGPAQGDGDRKEKCLTVALHLYVIQQLRRFEQYPRVVRRRGMVVDAEGGW